MDVTTVCNVGKSDLAVTPLGLGAGCRAAVSAAHPTVAAVIPVAKTPEEATANHRLLHTDVPHTVWEDFKVQGLLDPLAPTPV